MIREWIKLDDRVTEEMLGLIPMWLSEDDPRPAKEQLHENYLHGGGWMPFSGFTMADAEDLYWLLYPDDPPTRSLAMCKLRDETIIMYAHAWVAILQKDGSFEVSRMD